MVDASTFGLKPDFPIAGVADLYAKKPYLESLMNQAQQGQLVEGMKTLGAGMQSLAQRKMMMAQALAAAKMYMGTPEGQQMMGSNQAATGPGGQPVLQNQTAAGGVGQAPVPNAPQMSQGDVATAMYGESPSNMLTQLFQRQKQSQQFGLEQQKQAFAEKMKPLELAQQAQLTQALTGVKSREVSVQEQSNIRNQISSLEAKKAQAIKDFPELSGTFIRGILPPGSNAKEEAAFRDYQDTQKRIEDYNRQLYGGGSKSSSPASHMSSADLLAIINQTSPK